MRKIQDWKIGTRIGAAFGIVIAICCAIGYFAYNRVRDIDQKAIVVSDNHVPSVVALSNATSRAYREANLLRLHAASTSQQQMSELESAIQTLREANAKDLKTYESFPSDKAEDELYAKVKQDRVEFWAIFESILKESRLSTSESNVVAQQMLNTKLDPMLRQYTDDIQAVVDYNNKGSIDGMRAVRNAVSSTIYGIGVGLALSIFLAVIISLYIVRSITKPLAEAVETLDLVASGDMTATLDVDTQDEVGQMAKALNSAVARLNNTLREVAVSASSATSSSQQLAASSEDIASGAQEQAASLEETSASLEQITATVKHNAENAHEASQLASASKESALQGQEVVSKAIAAMEQISSASAKISDIISTIDEIAFQTNLLAVNAAVEAARAGEEGRGFAVVATEVRSLAQRSAASAKEIKGLIQDSLSKVEAGSVLVNRSGETLQGIVTSVKRVTDIVGEIAASSREQSAGIEQVNSAMSQMDQVTQSNSAQTEELSATAESLAQQASQLLEMVSKFKLHNGQSSSLEHLSAAVEQRKPAVRPAQSKVSRTKFQPKALKLQAAVSSGASDHSFEEF